MTQLAAPVLPDFGSERTARTAERAADKFADRRAQLAAAALHTLSELGYARTSLRDIAADADFSHGVLHYYFRDKLDLITEGVRQYKATCVHRYDDIVAESRTADELRAGFGQAMAATVRDDEAMHRLWYDLRTQSFYEPALREDVVAIDASLEQMIWRIVTRYAELADRPLNVTSALAYGLFDGIFQQHLLRFCFGDETALTDLAHVTERVLAGMLD